MKVNTSFLFLILSSSIFIFSSCEKDDTFLPEDIEETPCWELHPDIELDRRLLIQSFSTDDYLYLLSNNYFLKMDNTGLQQEYFISESGNLSLYDYPMLNEDLFAVGFDYYNLKYLQVYSTQNPEISFTIDLLAIDSTFKQINYFSGNGMSVNDSNKLLFSVNKNTSAGNSDPHIYFWMFDFEVDGNSLTIEFDKEIKIEIPGSGAIYGEKAVTEITAIDSDFYCSISFPNTTLKIGPAGDFEELFPLRDARLFTKNDTLFAIGHAFGCEVSYAIKPPQGNNWSSFSLGVNLGCWGDFYQINNRFVMVYNNNQFWEIIINDSEGTFEFKELDSSCIQLTSIRSIAQFKDKVYLSTHEGLYFKSIEDFFTYKEE